MEAGKNGEQVVPSAVEVGEKASRECCNSLQCPFFSKHEPIEADKMSMVRIGWSIVLVSNKIKYNNGGSVLEQITMIL